MNKYLNQYDWSVFREFLENEKKDPETYAGDFRDRLVVISGATSGIGYETAIKYASQGADLLCINRNPAKSEQLSEIIQKEYGVDCSTIIADFSRLEDVHAAGKELAAREREIDVLIHNAGVYLTRRTLSEDKLELMFQTIYLSAFIINHYLIEKFKKQNRGRIIFVSSEGHRFAIAGLRLDDLNWEKRRFTGSRSYGSAKTAQLLSVLKLSEIFAETGVTVNAMHPGNVKTNMGGTNGLLYTLSKKLIVDRTAKSPRISAEALYSLGADQKYAEISGKFFNLTTPEIPAPHALDREEANRLWEKSIKMAGF